MTCWARRSFALLFAGFLSAAEACSSQDMPLPIANIGKLSRYRMRAAGSRFEWSDDDDQEVALRPYRDRETMSRSFV